MYFCRCPLANKFPILCSFFLDSTVYHSASTSFVFECKYVSLFYITGTVGKTYKLVSRVSQAEVDNSDSKDDEPVGGDTEIHTPKYITLSELKDGKYNVIYAHQEVLLHSQVILKDAVRGHVPSSNLAVSTVVIDEPHMIS